MEAKNIGIEVKSKPTKDCGDELCPFHGSIKARGRIFTGRVISDKMRKTVTVEWDRVNFIPKYERYEKKRSRVKAHNPDCIEAKKNDIVRIAETRPISKTKNFVVIEKIGKERVLASEEELQEEMEKSRKAKRSKEVPEKGPEKKSAEAKKK